MKPDRRHLIAATALISVVAQDGIGDSDPRCLRARR